MTGRHTLAAILCSCLVLADAAAAASCRIIDATADFWPLVEHSDGISPAKQGAEFRATVMSKFPELYTRGVLGADDSAQLEKEAVATLAVARRNGLHARQTEQTLVREIPSSIARFSKTFPDFRCEFPIYLMISLGHMDGAGRVVGTTPALVFGVEMIDRIETPAQMPVFVAHELFHRYHYQVAGFSDDPSDAQATWRTLWAEGFSVGKTLIDRAGIRRPPFLSSVTNTASSAASATGGSAGCTATHSSVQPKIACFSLKPCKAAQPDPALRLLHGVGSSARK